jgi:hypothetical protein
LPNRSPSPLGEAGKGAVASVEVALLLGEMNTEETWAIVQASLIPSDQPASKAVQPARIL